jgi:hypothetical protein
MTLTNSDQLLAFMVLTLVWMCEVYSVICVRTTTSIRFFPRVFFFYFSLFHIYFFRYVRTHCSVCMHAHYCKCLIALSDCSKHCFCCVNYTAQPHLPYTASHLAVCSSAVLYVSVVLCDTYLFVHLHSFPFGFSYLALVTTVLFLQHSMLFFWNR